MNPLVSFGIITYNQEQFILDTLKGAVSQEYDNMEIIVSDDNSTDKTFEIVESFGVRVRIKNIFCCQPVFAYKVTAVRPNKRCVIIYRRFAYGERHIKRISVFLRHYGLEFFEDVEKLGESPRIVGRGDFDARFAQDLFVVIKSHA